MNTSDNVYFYTTSGMRDATRSLGVVLRWVTIILLMITPLRTVIADSGHCDMADMSNMDSMSNMVHMSGFDSSVHVDSTSLKSITKTVNADMSAHKCCKEGVSNNCQHHCGMNIHVSMFIQSVSFIQASFTTSLFETAIYSPVFRQQTPLLRPPSSLNS